MSKAKKKYQNWCSQEQYKHVINYPKLISSEIQFYKINNEIKFCKSFKPDRVHSYDTLKLFTSYKNSCNFLSKIKNTITSIKQYDIVFYLQGKTYLFHTYKILGFIHETINALRLSTDLHFQKGTIGDYNREKDYYKKEYLDNRKQLCKPNNPYKGINLISAFLYRNLWYKKEFTKYFLSYYAILGIDNLKQLNNEKLESKIIKNTLKIFQSGKVTINDCAKSLLSVLYYYFIYKMKIDNKKYALSIAQNLVYDVFKIYPQYKGSELLKNIYIKEVIGSHVIFSFDTKKEYITDANKKYLEQVIKEALISPNKFPLQMIRPSLDNPLQLYSLLTPSELLQKI